MIKWTDLSGIRERFLLSPLISVCIVFISISIVNYSLQCFIRNVFIVSDNCIYLIRNPKAQQLFPFDIQDVRKQYHLLLFSLPVSAFYSAIHRDIYIQSRSQLLLQQSASIFCANNVRIFFNLSLFGKFTTFISFMHIECQ